MGRGRSSLPGELSGSARLDLAVGAVVAIAAALTIVFILPGAVADPGYVEYAPLAPSYLPRALLVIIVLGGLAVIAEVFLVKPAPAEAGDEEEGGKPPEKIVPQILCLVVLGLYVWLLPLLGAVIASALCSVALLLVGGVRRPLPLLVYGVVVPAATVWFFIQVGHVPLPTLTRSTFV